MQKTQQNTQIKEDKSKAQKKKQIRFEDQVMPQKEGKKELKMTSEAQRCYDAYCDILQHFLDVRNKQIQKDKSKRNKVTFANEVQSSNFTAKLQKEEAKEGRGL